MSINTVNLLGTLSVYALVIGVILTAAGTLGQLWTGAAKEKYQRSQIIEIQSAAQSSLARAQAAELELRQLRDPRLIVEADRVNAVQELARFRGQEFAGVIASSGFDVRPLWTAINCMLREAGWVRGEPAGLSSGDPPAGIAIEAQQGIQIVIDGRFQAAVGEPAALLAEVLQTLVGGVALGSGRDQKEKRDNIITVRVGPKPQ